MVHFWRIKKRNDYISVFLHKCFGLDSEWLFAKSVLLDGKLGVMRVVASQRGLFHISQCGYTILGILGIVRDIVPPVINMAH